MTTYEKILACRPDSILDVVPNEIFIELNDPAHKYICGGNCYEWKYAVAKFLQPESVLEIGVRLGYSLCCFIMASPPCKYVEGIDSEVYVHGSNAIAWKNVKRFMVDSMFRSCDSAKIESLERDFDLVHIDGSHNYDTCLHDLNLCLGRAKAILIDDIYGCDDDRRACQTFTRQHPQAILESIPIPSLHGDLLLLMAH